MRRWGPAAVVALAALAGAATTMLVARGTGMGGSEVLHLARLLVPAIVATVVATVLAAPLLRRAGARTRFVAVALLAVGVGLANLAVLSGLMLVKHDALLVAALVAYSGAAGVGAALALSRSFGAGVERLAAGAERLASGELDARVGRVEGGPELERLAATLDDMAERLERTIAAEQRATVVRNDLITAVSHDLRTPLAGLRAMVEAIDDRVVDDPETFRRYAAEMRRSVTSLGTLVDDLFELVQLDAERVRAETRRTTLDDVVDAALAACAARAVEKRVRVETHLDGTTGVLVSPRLTRAVQNLLQNAIRHTPADGTIRVEGRRVSDAVELAVEDWGEGIPREAVDRVFEPFWRGDASRSDEGAGLGLALAKRIVEAAGGDLTVRSEAGAGARFALVVPCGRPAQPNVNE
ncbi:MAG TPA: HAMP domain-containing sensor histidine kinase [Actinomycetota bacterium]|nr:HAMP domain-containing sensor histidine kinase [Actinomycetota bacterium]